VRSILADLHIHTALSPCASKEMTPPSIVREALKKGLQMIAICDHNTAGNVLATQRAAAGYLSIIAGMEITTSEEVHVLGLFPSSEEAGSAAREVLNTLPDAGIDEKQPLFDENGDITGLESKMLYGSSSYRLEEAVLLIKKNGGLAIASHVDRPAFGVIGQLGFLPDDIRFDALEISAAGVAARKHENFTVQGKSILTSSDSHFLSDIGSSCSILEVREPSFTELAGAIHGIGGRRCRIA
jgi:PHP family Zn ribbon phosphoesterase